VEGYGFLTMGGLSRGLWFFDLWDERGAEGYFYLYTPYYGSSSYLLSIFLRGLSMHRAIRVIKF
jgi:hypothetical protein